ncbi:MAG: D-TA family PLP-dependent enzyme, partial [Geminicoccaceae bacterium]
HEVGVATEHRPGTYIYHDRDQARAGLGLEPCAMVVLTTVVSRPTEGRAILDAGSKTLSSDLNGLEGHGLVREYPQLALTGFSEEHGHVDCSASNARPRIGERVTVIPNHACAVTNLHDVVYGVRGSRVERVYRVAARGMVR